VIAVNAAPPLDQEFLTGALCAGDEVTVETENARLVFNHSKPPAVYETNET
jgi:hypothetical protein